MKTIKKLVSILAAVMLVFSIVPMTALAAANDTPFTDVKDDAWYTDSVNYMYRSHYMSGTGADKFSPNQTTTRAMFVTVLGRIANVDTGRYTTARFVDTPRDWAFAYINWASENAIVSGVGGNRFNPNGYITREQAATILYNYLKKDDSLKITNGISNGRPDSVNVSPWARTAMDWAMTNNIINGDSNGSIRPRNSATRAELACILHRFCQYVNGLGGAARPTPGPGETEEPAPTVEPTTSPDPTPAPCEHVWKYDDATEVNLDALHLDFDAGMVREWTMINGFRAMRCPCGLNCEQWAADHYAEYNNETDLTGAFTSFGYTSGCEFNHNRQATHEMTTVWPVDYDKHYANAKSAGKIVTDMHCEKCGAKRSKVEPGFDLNAARNWELMESSKTEVKLAFGADNETTFTESVGTTEYGGEFEATYVHGPYANTVYTKAVNKITGCTIDVKGTCGHASWARDWGDGSGYKGMRCNECDAFTSGDYGDLY